MAFRIFWGLGFVFVALPSLANGHEGACEESDPCFYWAKLLVYPEEARRQGLEGTVEYELMIDTTGHASSCKILSSSGHRLLDASTCAQLMKVAHFFPATDDSGHIVEAPYRGTFAWKLNDFRETDD